MQEFLAFAEANARHGFLFPMLVTAAHTGVRRSELIAARAEEVDFQSGTIQTSIPGGRGDAGHSVCRRLDTHEGILGGPGGFGCWPLRAPGERAGAEELDEDDGVYAAVTGMSRG